MSFDPKLIETKLTLERIPSNEIPSIAWDALEAGLDGPAIRRLASLLSPTYFEVRDVLPSAMKEMGLVIISKSEAAVRLAEKFAKELLLLDDKELLTCGKTFERLYIEADYPRELGKIGFLDDAIYLDQYWTSDPRETAKMVRGLLKDFLSSINEEVSCD